MYKDILIIARPESSARVSLQRIHWLGNSSSRSCFFAPRLDGLSRKCTCSVSEVRRLLLACDERLQFRFGLIRSVRRRKTMNLVQLFTLYLITLIIVNFWIRILILIFEMVVDRSKRKPKPSKYLPRGGLEHRQLPLSVALYLQNKQKNKQTRVKKCIFRTN